MKTLKGLFSLPTIIFLALILSGCMPDSLTKFKEDPPVKATNQGGSGNGVPDADENCVENNVNGGSCTPISALEYSGDGLSTIAGSIGACTRVYRYIGETNSSNLGQNITFNKTLQPSNVSNLKNFVFYSLTKISGVDLPVSINGSTGDLSFQLNGFAREGVYRVTATHAYTGNSECAVVRFSSINKINKANPTMLANEYVVLLADDRIIDNVGESLFNVGVGNSPNISSDNGANGVVRYVDRKNYAITMQIPSEQSLNVFQRGEKIDNNGIFTFEKSTITRVIYSFDRTNFPSSWPIKLYNDRNEVLSADEIKMQNVVLTPQVTRIHSGDSDGDGNYCLNANGLSGVDRRVIHQQNAANYIYLDVCDLSIKMHGTVTDEVTPTSTYSVSITSPKGTTVSFDFKYSSLSGTRPLKAVEDVYYAQNWKGGDERFVLKTTNTAAFVKPANLTGVVSLQSGISTITGTGTNFLSQLIPGSLFVVRGKVYEVATVISNTAITVVTAPTESVANIQAKPINWVLTGYFNNNTSSTTDDVHPQALIESVDTGENEIYITRVRGYFRPGMTLSVGAEYISAQSTINDVVYIFSPEDSLGAGLSPLYCGLPLIDNGSGTDLTCPADGDVSTQTMSFATIPNLSSGSNLRIATADGTLSEIVAADNLPVAAADQSLTIRARTLLNLDYTSPFIYRVLETPSHLTYGNFVLLQLTDVSSWVQGSFISSPAQIPLTEDNATQGIVRKTVGTDRVLVEVIQGQFKEEQGVDNIRYYASQRAEIIKSEVVSARFATGATNNNANADIGDYISSSSGARGVVVYVDGTDLYARLSSGRVSTGNALTNISRTPSQALGTVSAIESNQLRITTSAAPIPAAALNHVGALVTNSSQTARSVINAKSIASAPYTFYMQMTSGFFNIGENIDADRYYGASEGTINSVSTDARINLYRNSNSSIQKAVDVLSSDVEYEIIPTLPNGLSLDSATGAISGIATDSSGDKNFVIIARNEAGSTFYELTLRVHNHFEVVDKSKLPSYYLHQSGPVDANNLCRVTEDNILASVNSGNDTFRDLTCRLEVAELDLYNKGFTSGLEISAGLCQHWAFTPYNFWRFQPQRSLNAARTFGGEFASAQCSGLRMALTGSATANQFPDGEPEDQCTIYNKGTDDELNCDEGNYDLYDYNFSVDAAFCTSDSSITTPDACGTCTDNSFTTASTCPTPAETWTSNWRTGYCVYDTPAAQSAATCPGTWDATRNVCLDLANNGVTASGACNGDPDTHWTMCGYQIGGPENFECGGNAFACREGAITNVLDSTSILGGITGLTNASINGASQEWVFAGLTGIYASNMKLANFTKQNSCMTRANTTTEAFIAAANKRDNFEYHSASWNAYKDISRSRYDVADPFMDSQPFYTYECLDSGNEVIGRVRLQVREWDMAFTPDATAVQVANINYVDAGLALNSQSKYNPLAGENFDNQNDIDGFNFAHSYYNSCSASTVPLPPLGTSVNANFTTNSPQVTQVGHGYSDGTALYINNQVRRVAYIVDADRYVLHHSPGLATGVHPVRPVVTSAGAFVPITGTPDITSGFYNISQAGTNIVAGHVRQYLVFEGDDGYEEAHIIKHIAGGVVYLETAPTQDCTNCTNIWVRSPATSMFPENSL